jgi:hypothetical protein
VWSSPLQGEDDNDADAAAAADKNDNNKSEEVPRLVARQDALQWASQRGDKDQPDASGREASSKRSGAMNDVSIQVSSADGVTRPLHWPVRMAGDADRGETDGKTWAYGESVTTNEFFRNGSVRVAARFGEALRRGVIPLPKPTGLVLRVAPKTEAGDASRESALINVFELPPENAQIRRPTDR